jgi:hypothetical protein
MDGFLGGSLGREFVETLTRLPIVFRRSLQVFVVIVLTQLWQKSSQRRLRISHKAVINFCAPAQLFSADIDLDDYGILGENGWYGKSVPIISNRSEFIIA